MTGSLVISSTTSLARHGEHGKGARVHDVLVRALLLQEAQADPHLAPTHVTHAQPTQNAGAPCQDAGIVHLAEL
eukprot:CAMPEP_0117814642 /NCGR_PEP_ID=MMETSP0948-20121206/24279_1 /TAXON_ID=44440 /ORGANISM="Chattonella subsalsa, Strain CCMP2191" /LENGTH=73 /DNA_ID=CAMNT_0005652335 /DNA_START=85 /DNA_END=306 /DNA_ORIENTATION=-